MEEKLWLNWAIELQSLAQAGLTYGKDVYDRERYERIREISAEMISHKSEIPVEIVKNLFCNETGYQTPKLDTRAAIFNNGKILLVRENNGKWSLPGGWVDVNVSVKENTIKEVKEEAGVDVNADQIIAVQDRNKHNTPQYAYGVCKIFVLCSLIGGQKPTLKLPALIGSHWTIYRNWQKKKTIMHRLKCVSMHTEPLTGRFNLIKGGIYEV